MIAVPGQGSRRPGLALIGLATLIGCSIGFENFFSTANLNAIALSSSSLLIASLGAMALLVSGNLDVSVGSQFALVSVVTAVVERDTGSPPLAAVTAVVLGAVLGAVNGVLVELLRVSSLIVTLATLAAYRGLAYVVGGGGSVSGLTESFREFGQRRVLGVPVIALVALAIFVVGSVLLVTTVTGLRLYAIGGDRTSAVRLGVPVRRLVVSAFAGNGALIGVAALLSTAQLASGSPVVGVQWETDVLTAVILGGVAFTGGRGHPIGVLVGVVTIGIFNAGLIFAGLEDWYQQLVRGTMLLLALTSDQLLQRLRRARRGASTGAPPLSEGDPQVATTGRPGGRTLLEVDQLGVRFGGVQPLTDVSMTLRGGEVVCVVGDNAAGKSTLVNAIAGMQRPATGSISLNGLPLAADPASARELGVEAVFQSPALFPNLNGIDNLVLGLEPTRTIGGVWRIRDIAAARELARRRLGGFGVAIPDLSRPVSQLSGGERQLLAITRALRSDGAVVLLDEPTAGLGVAQATRVLSLVRVLAAQGRAVVYVTHDVEEVFELGDRVLVLQRGRVIHDGPAAQLTRLELLRLMSGRSRREAARTVAAVTSERLRIERDLHDGAQQELINAALMLRMATDALGDSPDTRLGELLESSRQTIRAALRELRDLSRGIYPVMLSERGLSAALDSLADRSLLPVEVRADGVPRLAEDIELAAYFVAAEAIANAQKHAGAQGVVVCAEHREGVLTVRISDDGRGGAREDSHGTGLRGLRTRVSELGGRLEVTSPPGRGTDLIARIPAVPTDQGLSASRRSP